MGDARPRIALVDDDPALLGLLRELLGDLEGYDVLTCDEGGRAFDFVRAHRPDLVLLDVRMQGEEAGWAILERLADAPETRAIPVIVCSAAVGGARDREPALRRPGVDVLAKPFDLDALLEKVRASLAPARG